MSGGRRKPFPGLAAMSKTLPRERAPKFFWAQNGGFTLLELLITMTILGIIMTVIMGGFRMGIRAWEKGEAKAQYNQKLRVVLDHILEEIRSAHSLTITSEEDDTKYHAFWGEPERIRFITTAPGLQSEPGLEFTRAVEYFVQPGEGLAMRSTPCLGGDCFKDLAEQEAVILDENVLEIDFRYCYIPEPDKEQADEELSRECEWVIDWDPTQKESIQFGNDTEQQATTSGEEIPGPPVQKLPHAVEITLILSVGEQERQLPPLVVPIYLGRELKAPKESL